MGPGSIFCCYGFKLRMSPFLQNGAWPHLFYNLMLIISLMMYFIRSVLYGLIKRAKSMNKALLNWFFKGNGDCNLY